MTQPAFDSFILLAEMRTGSNLLEEKLNAVPKLRCWGEAFNPHFMGKSGQMSMAGLTLAERHDAPHALLAAIRQRTDGLAGFRFFHDHDPRILNHCLADRRCAKIVLSRNPLDSFVSLAIARQTGQWRLGQGKAVKSAKVRFDRDAFTEFHRPRQAFRRDLLRRLRTSGQTAFHLDYQDLADMDVLNGLAAWLGIDATLDRTASALRVQNPQPLVEKVSNYDEMVAALADFDPFELERFPDFEPRRGAGVPNFVTVTNVPLIYLPLPNGLAPATIRWLVALGPSDEAQRGMTQKALRKWKRGHPGHRSFTVLRHPVPRLHDAFCNRILVPGPDCLHDLRKTLRSHYAVPIPDGTPGDDWDLAAHRAAFLAFSRFVGRNLGGQTGLKADPAWVSQSVLLQDMAQVMLPDAVLREDDLPAALDNLAEQVGCGPVAWWAPDASGPFRLSQIYDAEVETAVRAAYQRDYMMFGYDDWPAAQG